MPAVTPRSGHAQATAATSGTVLADTRTWFEVEGNVYFPPSTIDKSLMKSSDHSTHCPWKGDARYYNINVDGGIIENGAWYYPETFEGAADIKNYVAFYKAKVTVKVD